MGSVRDDSTRSGPPVVFRDDQTDRVEASSLEPESLPLRTDWRDFVAITLAIYQVLLGPLLIIVAGILSVYSLFWWLAR
jgi:hypothetical protein